MKEYFKVYRVLILFTIIAVSSTIVGCSTTRSTTQQESQDSSIRLMYPITSEQADMVLIEAMKYQFPDASISQVVLPYKGYFVTRRFLLDSQDFTSRMIPTEGVKESGEIVDGFYFEVIDAGTMPISGSVRASSLFDKIIEIANGVAKPIPIKGQ